MKNSLIDRTTAEAHLENEDSAKWLNKDRIWTFVFWFGISAGLALADFFKFTLAEPYISSIIDRVTLLGIPLIVTLANRTRFIKKG